LRERVGFAPGGTTDLLARIVADELRTIWNAAVVVENLGGSAAAWPLAARAGRACAAIGS
jgi:tripartite-type tricarboxylate transporter receptor subunit TctC